MWRPLTLHPESARAAVTAVEVAPVREGGVLQLRYRVTGDMAQVQLPPPAEPGFVDGLWRGTCLEAFVRTPAGEGYLELNLAPSGQWAAYRFDAYRSGMARAAELGAPVIAVRATPAALELDARVDLGAAGLAAAPWRLGLSAVVQAADGQASYWALQHPAGRPDFHHADCFALDLPAPDRP